MMSMPFTTPIRPPSSPDDQPSRMRVLRRVCTESRRDLPERPHGLIRRQEPVPDRLKVRKGAPLELA